MCAKMIKMRDEMINTKNETTGFQFHAELKSGFQSLIIDDDRNSDA